MPWTCPCQGDAPVVDSKHRGHLSTPELREMTTETLGLAHEAGARHFLDDGSGLEPNDSAVDLFERVTPLDRLITDRNLREAPVLPRHPEAAAPVQLDGTACRNRGARVRVFRMRDEARRGRIGGAR